MTNYARMRLYLTYALDTDVPSETAEACEAALQEAGCDMSACFQFLFFSLLASRPHVHFAKPTLFYIFLKTCATLHSYLMAGPVAWAREVRKMQRASHQGPIAASHTFVFSSPPLIVLILIYLCAHLPTAQSSQLTALRGDSLFSQASKMMKLGGDLWTQGVKKLVPTSGVRSNEMLAIIFKDLAITRITEALMDLKQTDLTQVV
jgi:hypothetical protein